MGLAATKQKEWCTSAAAGSTPYGKAVTETTTTAQAGGTAGVKTPTTTGPDDMANGRLEYSTRTVRNNVSKTTMTAIDESVETEENEQTMQQLMERVRKLEEQAKEMCQQIQRLVCGNATSDSAEYWKKGASSKGENGDEDHFGWCRWKGLVVDPNGTGTELKTTQKGV